MSEKKSKKDLFTLQNKNAGEKELTQPDSFIHPTHSSEIDEAEFIFEQLSSTRIPFSQSQKEILGNKISQSIKRYQKRNLIIKWSAAASIFLILGIGTMFQIFQQTDFRSYVENISPIPESTSTRLFLSGQQSIDIDSNESIIEYTSSGNQIKIDSSNPIEQQINADHAEPNTVTVPYGKRTMIILSDNSKVWLNSGSRLVYPACFDKNRREVYLEGEAIFEVSHNPKHPFHVITRDLEVKVLGTVFNVTAYPDETTTQAILESGSIELKYEGTNLWGTSNTRMNPGTLASYDPLKKVVEQTAVDTRYYTSWKDGFFIFRQQPLNGILKKVARYYNVSIHIDDPMLGNETFSGYLDLRNSVSQVLEVIAELTSLNIEETASEIVITKEKSN